MVIYLEIKSVHHPYKEEGKPNQTNTSVILCAVHSNHYCSVSLL